MASAAHDSDRPGSAQDLQLLIDSAPALIHTGLPDGYLDFFNQAWLEYLGRPLADVQGWKWTAVIHPDDVEGIVAVWRASLASGNPFLHEARVRRADGEYRWMLHHKVAIRDEHGKIVKWHGSSIDIEDRKQAEEQLRRNSQELQRSEFYLAEGQRLGHMGSWAFGPDGFDYWSPELFRMHGLDPASKPPCVQEYLDGVHPEDREFMADLINGALAKPAPFDATKRIVCPNGEVRYIRCVGVPVLESENLKKFVGSAIDVTEHELLTQELRRREAYLTEAQRLSQTGSFGCKPSTGEMFWSEETFRIYGYDRSTRAAVERVLERVHPEDRALVQERMDRANRDEEDCGVECRLLLPDGSVKHVSIVAHALKNESGTTEFVGAVTDVTARKGAEEAIRRSEAYLAEAQRLSHTGSWAWNVRTGAVFWSQEIFRIYGYNPQGTGPTWEQFLERVHPEDRAQIEQRAQIETTRKEWVDSHGDFRIVLPDGTMKYLHSVAHPARDSSGEITEIIGTVVDVTEHEHLTQELRRREAYLAGAQRLSHTGSFGWKPDTGEIVWSDETYRIFEYDRSLKPTIDLVAQRVHPEDRGDFKGVIDSALAGATNFEHAYRLLLPDGRIKYVYAIANVLWDASGSREFVGAATDITERKAAEGKIREQEMELRQMLDLAPQHVAVFGPGGERLFANRVALDHVGLSLQEWQQKPGGFFSPGWFIHPDDRERAARTYSDSVRSGGSAYELELRVQAADGNYRWLLVRFNPLRDEQGQIMRWYVASTDIDERKKAEERLQHENVVLREEVDKASMFEEIVGTSPVLQKVLSRISKVGPTDSTVLLTGETGTGKELIARAIHRRSQRSSRPFVSVNCAAVPRDLIASELFGHEKGAFTGALQRRLGRFELAQGGTIFLDEVGELPAETQVALLRVLQEREFERVGGNQLIRADVRVIAATNRDLEVAITTGSFRRDLFYRLSVFPIESPPLRERREDIPMLVEYFIGRYARKAGKRIRNVEKITMQLLSAYSWPGNIRELQNVIERSVILCDGDTISVDPSWLSFESTTAQHNSQSFGKKSAAQEKETIEAALTSAGGRVSGPLGAAAALGIPASTLESKIRSLGINKFRFKHASR